MSYSISYGPDKTNIRTKSNGHAGLIGAVLIVLVCAIAIGWSLPEQARQFTEALFPWTRTDVSAALAILRENVMDGQPLKDAVSAFCHGIINEASPIQ